jgi:hypothetical protein
MSASACLGRPAGVGGGLKCCLAATAAVVAAAAAAVSADGYSLKGGSASERCKTCRKCYGKRWRGTLDVSVIGCNKEP